MMPPKNLRGFCSLFTVGVLSECKRVFVVVRRDGSQLERRWRVGFWDVVGEGGGGKKGKRSFVVGLIKMSSKKRNPDKIIQVLDE